MGSELTSWPDLGVMTLMLLLVKVAASPKSNIQNLDVCDHIAPWLGGGPVYCIKTSKNLFFCIPALYWALWWWDRQKRIMKGKYQYFAVKMSGGNKSLRRIIRAAESTDVKYTRVCISRIRHIYSCQELCASVLTLMQILMNAKSLGAEWSAQVNADNISSVGFRTIKYICFVTFGRK